MLKKLKKFSPAFAAFLSAISVSLYILLVSLVISNGNIIFGPLVGFMGPLIFLTLFSVSVLVCGFLVLGFPFYLFWFKKQIPKALKIVGFTTLWLFVFFLLYLSLNLIKVF